MCLGRKVTINKIKLGSVVLCKSYIRKSGNMFEYYANNRKRYVPIKDVKLIKPKEE